MSPNQPYATHPFFLDNLLRTWTTLSLFDEISWLFETTRQHFRPRNVVLAIAELSRTITRFHQNNDNVVQAMRTFRTFRQMRQHQIQVELFVEIVEIEIVYKKGMSGIRLVQTHIFGNEVTTMVTSVHKIRTSHVTRMLATRYEFRWRFLKNHCLHTECDLIGSSPAIHAWSAVRHVTCQTVAISKPSAGTTTATVCFEPYIFHYVHKIPTFSYARRGFHVVKTIVASKKVALSGLG